MHYFTLLAFFLPSATSLRQGNVFTHVCDSVHGGGGGGPLANTPLAVNPLGRHPSSADTPPDRHSTPQVDTHPTTDGHCSGWYASYWNAFLFSNEFYILHYLRNLGNISRPPAILLRPEDEGCQPPLVRDVKTAGA